MSKRERPTWTKPADKTPVLKLFNSLTRQKETFIPSDSRKVNWYSCGPTVYDAAHMGHARSYISFDILRRVLSDYFKYNVFYVMNITDIDDKIIKRARQKHLFAEYLAKGLGIEDVLQDVAKAVEFASDKFLTSTDPDKKQMFERMLVKIEDATSNVKRIIESNINGLEDAHKHLLDVASEPLSDWLDSKLGTSVRDNSIFVGLPKHWEEEFHKDMDALNVQRPSVLTRVSEFIPEIIDYIKRIIDNGYAYVSNMSVYFDVAEFDRRPNHFYAKLVPEAYGDLSSLHEGEGELSMVEQSEKKSPNDFALWKSSKPGEPMWESPWGPGRPGWHIECSAMASKMCGSTLDIHTGGVDLKFPHHDNEIAQSEAFFESEDWVKYFLHSGHLTISGCKMSKSLKNFITIEDALKEHSARQLRLAFLLHSWKDTLDYSANTMDMAIQYEKLLNEFFLNIKSLTMDVGVSIDVYSKWTNFDVALYAKFLEVKDNVHVALCDNIDTRSTLDSIRELITNVNIYLKNQKTPSLIVLEEIAMYVTDIFKMFGVINFGKQIGFPVTSASSANLEQTLMPYLKIIAEFRAKIRASGRALKANDILIECDNLRDDTLPNVGVRLEDKDDTLSYAIKLTDRETLLKERAAKQQAEMEKQAIKEKRKQEQEALKAQKEAQMRIAPTDMFRAETSKYSAFDDNGLPTHDESGAELSKGLVKKLQKLQLAQEKKYKEYLASLS